MTKLVARAARKVFKGVVRKPSKKIKAKDDPGKITSPTTKQLTLQACLSKIGSPCEIVKRSSLGATVRPSLLEVLSGLVEKEDDKKSDCIVVGVAGEDHGQSADIPNGSRDRLMG